MSLIFYKFVTIALEFFTYQTNKKAEVVFMPCSV